MRNSPSGLVIVNQTRVDWYAAVTSAVQVIGRGNSADISIPLCHTTVSRRHAHVRVDRGTALITDLKSRWGTRINGLVLAPEREVRIASGDRILLGKLELLLIEGEEVTANAGSPPATEEDTRTIELTGHAPTTSEFDALEKLSAAEKEVVMWVSRGFTDPTEIGKHLHRSKHTVRTQMNSIFKKLSVHSRDELASLLLRNHRSDAFPLE